MLFVRRRELPICLFIICVATLCVKRVTEALVAYPRGSSQGVSQLNNMPCANSFPTNADFLFCSTQSTVLGSVGHAD